MKEENYHPVISGQIRYSDNGEFSYFWPNDLPFDLEFDKRIYKKIETAIITLSKLDGKVSQMTEQERNILLVPFVLMESTESSAIEGTGTTMEDIYRSERVEETDPRKLMDNLEVLNYRNALNHATSMNGDTIDEDLLLELHRILMKGVRGENKNPGTYRSVQVLVGNRGDTLESARFVPMPPEQVPWKIRNLFEYINSPDENTLISAALSHYQFETIHPFTDGNGRMGRLLIMLILSKSGILEHPVLYLSGYFNNRREEYIERLNRVREEDDFRGWIDMFLDALIEQSQSSIRMIDSLFQLRQRFHSMDTDRHTLQLLDSLFVNPFVRKADVADICNVHLSTAGKIVNDLVDAGILSETTGKRRNQLFVCREIMNVLNSY
ncbi:Fic family protein [methanogenic archaeon mixed culture ISO4-G1]|nr:Fic family protein [methanogenic archaeon mixed culture ISO4-G1]